MRVQVPFFAVLVAGAAGCAADDPETSSPPTVTASRSAALTGIVATDPRLVLESPRLGDVFMGHPKGRKIRFSGTVPDDPELLTQSIVIEVPAWGTWSADLTQPGSWKVVDLVAPSASWSKEVMLVPNPSSYLPGSWDAGDVIRVRVRIGDRAFAYRDGDGNSTRQTYLTLVDGKLPYTAAERREGYLRKGARWDNGAALTPGELDSEAGDYYQKHADIFPYTFDDYLTRWGFSPSDPALSVVYYNQNELGWGRYQKCVEYSSWRGSYPVNQGPPATQGKGYTCFVSNYDDGAHGPPAADPDQYLNGAVRDMLFGDTTQRRNSVIIFYDNRVETPPDQRVQFATYARDPATGVVHLERKVQLDSGEPTFHPMTCLECHGGDYDPVANTVKRGNFLPADINTFKFPTVSGLLREDQEASFLELNRIALRTNMKASLTAFTNNLYGKENSNWVDDPNEHPPTLRPTPIPHEWRSSDPVEESLYTKVYKPSCESCHRALDLPGATFANSLLDFISSGPTIASHLLNSHTLMPDSELMMRRFAAGPGRAHFIDALENPSATFTTAGHYVDTIDPTLNSFLDLFRAQSADGDNRADLTVVGYNFDNGYGYTPYAAIVASSVGDGNFGYKAPIFDRPEFGYWSSIPGVKAVSGDYNGDGRADIALMGAAGWASIPVAFQNPDGSYRVTNEHPPNTWSLTWNTTVYGGDYWDDWLNTAGVKILTGRFDGDACTDIALTGPYGWWVVPIARSRCDGSGVFDITMEISYPAQWVSWFAANGGTPVVLHSASGNDKITVVGSNLTDEIYINGFQTIRDDTGLTSLQMFGQPHDGTQLNEALRRGGKLLTGKFDADALDDLAILEDSPHMLVAALHDTWLDSTLVNLGDLPRIASWNSSHPFVANLNGDGIDDIAVLTNGGMLPVALSSQALTYTMSYDDAPNLGSWSTHTGAKLVVGDFSGDGKDDLALTGGQGWSTIPMASFKPDRSWRVTNGLAPSFNWWLSLGQMIFVR